MNALFESLGVNWRLLLAQGFNFFVLFGAITVLVYRPLFKILEERKKRISDGIENANTAEKRLQNIETLEKEKMRAAEKEAIQVLKDAEIEVHKKSQIAAKVAEEKAAERLQETEKMILRLRDEALKNLSEESKTLLKAAIIKYCALDPKYINESLIEEASLIIKDQGSAPVKS